MASSGVKRNLSVEQLEIWAQLVLCRCQLEHFNIRRVEQDNASFESDDENPPASDGDGGDYEQDRMD